MGNQEQSHQIEMAHTFKVPGCKSLENHGFHLEECVVQSTDVFWDETMLDSKLKGIVVYIGGLLPVDII